MKLIPAQTSGIIKQLFPGFVWTINTSEKILYLTFDDGPTPQITPWVLEQLKSYDAKATFFCIGKNIEKHPSIFEDIINNGHSLGNHTFTHVNGWRTSTKTYLDDIWQCEASLLSSLKNYHSSVKLFRPPYGKLKPKQARKLQQKGYKIVMWDVLSFDWDKYTLPNQCLNNVLKNATKGSIIVFHDSVKASQNLKYALPILLDTFSRKGFKFEAL